MKRNHRRDVRKKRVLYGVGAAVVATATIGTVAMASQDTTTTDSKPASAATVLQAQFKDAAREFDVPQSVLMAVSYRQTLWESHDGEPSTSGAYNVMGLTRVTPQDVVQQDDKERLAHSNASDSPEVERKFDAAKALRNLPKEAVDTDDPRLHTLDKAAGLIDAGTDAVQDSTEQSIRAGAALLAEYQRQATDSLPDSPGEWYPAVARYSQSPDKKGADLFAERVFESIRTGERQLTADGQQVTLPAAPSVEPVKPSKLPLAASFASTTAAPTPECPSGLKCNFVPAEDPKNGTRNYSLASRPAGGFDIRQIVIHDTEGDYQGALETFQDSAQGVSTHYLIRASDGLVTQMVENKNLAWHAGNWSLNMHSIGVEHEGFAIQAGKWYTEPQYESSAALVKFLAGKYGIPLDREHIIGHDEVPGPLDGNVGGMHWDAGPFWDWNHYMSLMGAPTGAGGAGGPVKAGQVVRVVPPFTTANQPPLTYDGKAVAKQPANFGYLYTSPSTTSATITDPYLPGVKSTDGPNWANKVVAGGKYVVAEVKGDWTAIWYGGQKAWFSNPGGQFTAPVAGPAPAVVKLKAGATARIYGRSFPEASAYTGTGATAPTDNPDHLSKYKLPAGQAYVRAGNDVQGDDYFGSSQIRVVGNDVYTPIRYNHRIAWVKASDVQQASSVVPDAGTDRYNVIARDSAGDVWQYQGTGSATSPYYKRYKAGYGWQIYNSLTAMTAMRADGTGDVVARDKDGVLWYYRGSGNPDKPYLARLKVGSGWTQYNGLWGMRDLDGDGKADLLARNSSGVIYFYKGTGDPAKPFAAKAQIGTGWQIYDVIAATGDLNGDGKADFVARDKSGVLWLYTGTGSATAPYAKRTQIGSGWGAYKDLLGPSDLNRDGIGDLVARDGSGVLWFYRGTGDAAKPFAAKAQVGTGWQIYNSLI
ncbi:N-acetylmuramoyl-L-alanine amidase [Streptomyces sp. RKAG290]|uniref:N-acetylmuramoyl-L-alanine amidase n=1 Tax=Streptomyces sp. RKAG290 TaxID=2888348 RepID=UPI0020333E0A|nr:N-acetylmuramoyl-L-alanine amidase [Streptomyces sp. RKAG290]MCM2414607.1 N-acetylmuramoyl-L-alanine amidase [Streptomyces sp. RKAG290]